MKTTFLILTSCLFFIFSGKKIIIPIIDGQGADGLILQKSTIGNAIDKYGKEINYSEGIIDYANKAAVHINRFYFSNNIVLISLTEEGNEQNIDLKKSVISEIGILYPVDATTDKGVSLKSDKFEKIIKVYGQPEKQQIWKNSKDLHYYSKGVSFSCNNTNNHIEKIAIYKKGQRPDFYYWYGK